MFSKTQQLEELNQLYAQLLTENGQLKQLNEDLASACGDLREEIARLKIKIAADNTGAMPAVATGSASLEEENERLRADISEARALIAELAEDNEMLLDCINPNVKRELLARDNAEALETEVEELSSEVERLDAELAARQMLLG